MKQQIFKDFKNIDKTIVLLYLILVVVGWLSIYAADYKEVHRGIFDISTNYGKQLIWIFAAFFIGFAMLLIDVKLLQAFAYQIFAISMLVLVAVLFFGTEINASKSWFTFGQFSIQPSEFTKFTAALAIAKYINSNKNRALSFKIRLMPLVFLFIPFALVMLQNDTGTAMVFGALFFMLYREGYISGVLLSFAAAAAFLFILTLLMNEFVIIGILALIAVITAIILRNNKKEVMAVVGLFVLLSVYVYSVDYTFENVLQPHQKNRIEVLVDPNVDPLGAGYNLNQSKIAIGSGGLWGKGFLAGTQTKFDFVPEQSTDFIFCTIGEEWGWAGSAALIIIFVVFLIRIILVAEKQRSAFSRIVGYSTACLLFFHFAVNIGMTIGLVPVIGIPLPFISYGGSSLLAFTIMIFTFLKLDMKKLEML